MEKTIQEFLEEVKNLSTSKKFWISFFFIINIGFLLISPILFIVYQIAYFIFLLFYIVNVGNKIEFFTNSFIILIIIFLIYALNKTEKSITTIFKRLIDKINNKLNKL